MYIVFKDAWRTRRWVLDSSEPFKASWASQVAVGVNSGFVCEREPKVSTDRCTHTHSSALYLGDLITRRRGDEPSLGYGAPEARKPTTNRPLLRRFLADHLLATSTGPKMCRKNLKKRNYSGQSVVKSRHPAGVTPQAHSQLEAARLEGDWTVSQRGLFGHDWALCGGNIGNLGQWGFLRTIQDTPQRAECIDDDDYFLRNRDNVDTFSHVVDQDFSNIPCKRAALAATVLGGCEKPKQDLINKLPDELLLEVFRCMPRARDRAVCASVSMRWLMLESHMQRKDFHTKQSQLTVGKSPNYAAITGNVEEDMDEVYSQEVVSESGMEAFDDDTRVERQPQWAIGDLSRSLEGGKATDIRLAAIAIGTGARGGLGKLSIRGGGSAIGLDKGVTDVGLSAIGLCCAALRTLTLWDCPNITDEGLSAIGKGCHLLQKVDLLKCSLVGNLGLQSIAKNCHLLSSLSIDDCVLIGDCALNAVGEGCMELMSLNIRNCALVGDDGLEAVVLNCKKLKKMKLHGLRIGDKGLMSVGLHCKVLTCLCLHSLDLVSEGGFMSFCKLSGMKALRRFSISNCNSFSDGTLAALGNSNGGVKHVSLVKCEGISDQGLMVFLQIASSLEVLHVERCNLITGIGLTAALSSRTGKLKEIHFRKCDGIQDYNVGLPSVVSLPSNSAVKSVCLANCGGVGDRCLSLVGLLCHQLTGLDLTGLAGVTDEGLLALLYCGDSKLSSVNVTGCVKLTDWAVCAIAQRCGGSLRNFVLDGCKMVTDTGLMAVGKHCVGLEDLDVSQCTISDEGVSFLVAEVGLTLNSLNLSGCRGITDRVLSLIVERCHSLVGLNLKHCQGLTQSMVEKFVSRLWRCDVLFV